MNFNRHNSSGHHGSKRRKQAQHVLTWIARRIQSHLHQHSYNHLCEAPAQLLQNLESNFYLKVGLPEEWGKQTGVPGEKTRQTTR